MTATAKTRPWESGKPGKTGAPASTLPEAKAPATAPEAEKKPASNLATMLDEYATVHAEIAGLEKIKKKLGDEIKKLGVGEYLGNKCKLVVTETTSRRLDTEKIKDAMPDGWFVEFSKSSTTRTLNVKPLI